MEKVNKIYNETLEELANYNPDEVFEKIIGDLNRGVNRKIEEYQIDLSDSVGNKKTTKKTCKLKKILATLLAVSLFFSCMGCSKDNKQPVEQTSFDSYKSLLNQFEHDLMVDAYDKGYNIGYSMFKSSMETYDNGEFSITSDEDILALVSMYIDSDNWYLNFEANYSIVGEDGINDYKYSVAQMIYEGLIFGLGYEELKPEYLDEFLEQIIGKNIVLEKCDHFDELIYNDVNRDLTEEEKISNIIILANYYRNKGKGRNLGN